MSQETLPAFSPLAESVEVGSLYEHYSGRRYEVIGVGRHSETLEELLIYQAQYGDYDIWVRPLAMFFETVTINGKTQPRFKLIQE